MNLTNIITNLHFICITSVMFFGWTFPKKYLIYYLITTILLRYHWEMSDDKCIITLLTNKLNNKKEIGKSDNTNELISKLSRYFPNHNIPIGEELDKFMHRYIFFTILFSLYRLFIDKNYYTKYKHIIQFLFLAHLEVNIHHMMIQKIITENKLSNIDYLQLLVMIIYLLSAPILFFHFFLKR